MKTLYLLRHAEAATGAVDIERPLTADGLRAAQKLGDAWRQRFIEPAMIYCSAAKRTRQTVEALGLSVKPAFMQALYNADPETLLELVREVSPAIPSLLVVGHNPGMYSLARTLAEIAVKPNQLRVLESGYAPGTLAILNFENDWADVGSDGGKLMDLIIP